MSTHLSESLNSSRWAGKIRQLRKEKGWSQADLADRLGVSQSRVSRIERGDMERAELATLRSYVRALGGELEISARFGDERVTLD